MWILSSTVDCPIWISAVILLCRCTHSLLMHSANVLCAMTRNSLLLRNSCCECSCCQAYVWLDFLDSGVPSRGYAFDATNCSHVKSGYELCDFARKCLLFLYDIGTERDWYGVSWTGGNGRGYPLGGEVEVLWLVRNCFLPSSVSKHSLEVRWVFIALLNIKKWRPFEWEPR